MECVDFWLILDYGVTDWRWFLVDFALGVTNWRKRVVICG